MHTSEVRLGLPEWTLADLQSWIRQRENTGRSLLAISPLSEFGISHTTAITFAFTGNQPPTPVTLRAYDGITVPDPGASTPICIGRCILQHNEAYVLATR